MTEKWNEAQVGAAVESHRLRGAQRAGTIVETMGSPVHAYFRVRRQDGRETTLHPGLDATLRAASAGRRRAIDSPMSAAPPASAPRPACGPVNTRPPELRASPADRLVIRRHHLGEPDRDGEILEAIDEGGRPPFRVRRSETGREALFFPGPDGGIEHYPGRRRTASRRA
jgi:uncharacterized protein DUF1918